jgi:hypothetical protein
MINMIIRLTLPACTHARTHAHAYTHMCTLARTHAHTHYARVRIPLIRVIHVSNNKKLVKMPYMFFSLLDQYLPVSRSNC